MKINENSVSFNPFCVDIQATKRNFALFFSFYSWTYFLDIKGLSTIVTFQV